MPELLGDRRGLRRRPSTARRCRGHRRPRGGGPAARPVKQSRRRATSARRAHASSQDGQRVATRGKCASRSSREAIIEDEETRRGCGGARAHLRHHLLVPRPYAADPTVGGERAGRRRAPPPSPRAARSQQSSRCHGHRRWLGGGVVAVAELDGELRHPTPPMPTSSRVVTPCPAAGRDRPGRSARSQSARACRYP